MEPAIPSPTKNSLTSVHGLRGDLHILCDFLAQRAHLPSGFGDESSSRGCANDIFAGVVKLDVAIGFGNNIDGCRRLGFLSKEVLEIGKVVRDRGRVGAAKELRQLDQVTANRAKLDVDKAVNLAPIVRLGAVDGCVGFESNVKCLAGPKVGLIRRKDACSAYLSAKL